MRRVAEILSAYPGQGVGGQRFLLRALERQPLGLDAGEVLDFLRQNEAGKAHNVARVVEDTVFARLARDRALRAAGKASDEAGQWTRFLGQGAGEGGGGASLEPEALPALSRLVPALRENLERGTPRARAALRVLARIRTPESLAALTEAAETPALLPAALGAMGAMGGPDAAAAALEILRARTDLPMQPGLIYPFRSLATPELAEFLAGKLDSLDVLPMVGAVIEGFADLEYRPLLKAALASGEPWTILHVVESLGRLGGERQVAELAALFGKLPHPMVRAACLQSLAETGVAAAAEVAVRGLDAEEDPLVRSAAIEALVALGAARGRFREPILACLDSPHPRLAMCASLACVTIDPPRAAARIGAMVRGDAGQLLQGLHCLTYIDHASAAPLLAEVTRKVPEGPLRNQGLYALGRRAARSADAAKALVGFLKHESGEVRRRAAWYLAGAEPGARVGVLRVMLEGLSREEEPAVAASILEAIGLAGPCAEAATGALASYGAHPDSRVRRAAAWSLAIAFPASDAAAALGEGEPVLAGWAALRTWVREGQGMGELEHALRSEEGKVATEALLAARWAAEIPAFAGEVPTFSGLVAALKAGRAGTAPGPEVEEDAAEPAEELVAEVQRLAGGAYRPPPIPAAVADAVRETAPDEVAELLTAEEAGAALDAGGASVADGAAAAVQVSLFSMDQAVVDEAVGAADPAGPGGGHQRLLVAGAILLAAFLLGQLLR